MRGQYTIFKFVSTHKDFRTLGPPWEVPVQHWKMVNKVENEAPSAAFLSESHHG